MSTLSDARRHLPAFTAWRVVRDGTGAFLLRDEAGNDPLKHPDSSRRLENLCLAAQAPELRSAATALALYMDRHQSDGYGFTRKLVAFALGAVANCRPLVSWLLEIEARREQEEIDWEAA